MFNKSFMLCLDEKKNYENQEQHIYIQMNNFHISIIFCQLIQHMKTTYLNN